MNRDETMDDKELEAVREPVLSAVSNTLQPFISCHWCARLCDRFYVLNGTHTFCTIQCSEHHDSATPDQRWCCK